MQNSPSIQDQVKAYLRKDELSKALECLKKLHPISEEEDKILVAFAAKHEKINKARIKGLIHYDEAGREFARLRDDIMSFINSYVQEEELPSPYPLSSPQNNLARPGLAPSPSIRPKKRLEWKYLLAPLIIVLSVSAFYFLPKFFSDDTPTITTQPNSFSVLIHGHKGKEIEIIDKEWILEFVHTNFTHRAIIDSNGIAEFKEVPGSLFEKGNDVKMKLKGVPKSIYFLHADSTYQLSKGDTLHLELRIEGLDRIHGRVEDALTRRPIPGVKIKVGTLDTLSDSFGEFTLIIPDEQQSRSQIIFLSKPGYESNSYPEKQLEGGRRRVFQLNPE